MAGGAVAEAAERAPPAAEEAVPEAPVEAGAELEVEGVAEPGVEAAVSWCRWVQAAPTGAWPRAEGAVWSGAGAGRPSWRKRASLRVGKANVACAPGVPIPAGRSPGSARPRFRRARRARGRAARERPARRAKRACLPRRSTRRRRGDGALGGSRGAPGWAGPCLSERTAACAHLQAFDRVIVDKRKRVVLQETLRNLAPT